MGASWRLSIWVQDGQGITVFKNIGDGFDSIWLVDGIIVLSSKKYSSQILFVHHKGTDSGTRHNYFKVVFIQNIYRDDGHGYFNNVLDDKSPGIELCKLLIWEYGKRSYLCIKICTEYTKLRGMITIKSPD